MSCAQEVADPRTADRNLRGDQETVVGLQKGHQVASARHPSGCGSHCLSPAALMPLRQLQISESGRFHYKKTIAISVHRLTNSVL